MKAAPGWRDDGLTLGVAAVAGAAALGLFPTAAMLLSDHGHGYQLAGAAEILAGRHPFVDFRDVYGLLPHYASALAHVAAGGRVGGELALVVGALTAGYALFFRLLRRGGVAVGLSADGRRGARWWSSRGRWWRGRCRGWAGWRCMERWASICATRRRWR